MAVPEFSPGVLAHQPATRVLRPKRSVPADVVRKTRAEISLSNLRFNLRALQKRTEAAVWCVLKADGYGHGAKACARTLERAGAAGLCVALVEEGIELREAGIRVPILVMGGTYGNAYEELLAHQLTPVLCNAGQLEKYAQEIRYSGHPPAPIHVKVDTGMGRLGALPAEIPELARALARTPELQLEGLMTHFACAGMDPELLAEPLRLFEKTHQQLRACGAPPQLRHAANSAALLSSKRTHLDVVRPGLGIFGVEPVAGLAPELKPVMRVVSSVIAIRELQAGQGVGYGSTWKAQQRSVVATVPIGYADGLSRQLGEGGHLLVRGQRAPIIGAISMDMTTIDVTAVPGVEMGEEVVVMGSQQGPNGSDTITAEELATARDTIPWEILTQVSRRVPRFFRES